MSLPSGVAAPWTRHCSVAPGGSLTATHPYPGRFATVRAQSRMHLRGEPDGMIGVGRRFVVVSRVSALVSCWAVRWLAVECLGLMSRL
jgi:hypothetical protein